MQLGRDFVRALKQITQERNLPLEVISSGLEAAMISAYRKYRGGIRISRSSWPWRVGKYPSARSGR
jgi:hypothetical protein